MPKDREATNTDLTSNLDILRTLSLPEIPRSDARDITSILYDNLKAFYNAPHSRRSFIKGSISILAALSLGSEVLKLTSHENIVLDPSKTYDLYVIGDSIAAGVGSEPLPPRTTIREYIELTKIWLRENKQVGFLTSYPGFINKRFKEIYSLSDNELIIKPQFAPDLVKPGITSTKYKEMLPDITDNFGESDNSIYFLSLGANDVFEAFGALNKENTTTNEISERLVKVLFNYSKNISKIVETIQNETRNKASLNFSTKTVQIIMPTLFELDQIPAVVKNLSDKPDIILMIQMYTKLFHFVQKSLARQLGIVILPTGYKSISSEQDIDAPFMIMDNPDGETLNPFGGMPDSLFFTDGVHPNKEGYNLLAKRASDLTVFKV